MGLAPIKSLLLAGALCVSAPACALASGAAFSAGLDVFPSFIAGQPRDGRAESGFPTTVYIANARQRLTYKLDRVTGGMSGAWIR
jgi:hypothetical protein